MIGPGLPPAPIHHEGGAFPLHRTGEELDDAALAALVSDVRASARRATSDALDELVAAVPEPIMSVSLRAWPHDFPQEIAQKRRIPYESRADAVMYLEVLAELARERNWAVHLYEAKNVEADAARLLGDRAHEVLHSPREALGPPWAKDHRMALAATIVAS